MELLVEHDTTYTYDEPVRHSVQYLRLTPNQSARQTVWRWSVVAPEPMTVFTDGFGNTVHVLTMAQTAATFTISVRGHVTTSPGASATMNGDEGLPPAVYLRSTHLTTVEGPVGDLLRVLGPIQGDMAGVERIAAAVADRFTYTAGATDAATTAADALGRGQGVCQDYVHVLVACCRALNIPARYVSGYYRADPNGIDYDANHAWAEAYLPDLGWMGVDVTNRTPVDERYIRLACGLDYLEAAPVRGMRRGGGNEGMQVRVRVAVPRAGGSGGQQQ